MVAMAEPIQRYFRIQRSIRGKEGIPISLRRMNCRSRSMSSSLSTRRFGSIGEDDFPNQLKAEDVEEDGDDFSSFFFAEYVFDYKGEPLKVYERK